MDINEILTHIDLVASKLREEAYELQAIGKQEQAGKRHESADELEKLVRDIREQRLAGV